MIQYIHSINLLPFIALHKPFIKPGLLLAGLFLSAVSFANNISLSTQRIYLDQAQSTANFVIKNREMFPQECTLDTTYFDFDEHGSMLPYTDNEAPFNAAEKIARFSPKRFKIEANARQTVRFTFRRKRDIADIEHRSYLAIKCRNVQTNSQFAVNNDLVSIPIKAQLQQNIPLIVRPKALMATLRFSDVSLENNKLSFILHRKGPRSVYGKVKLVDLNSDKLLEESGNFAIYHETKQKSLYMAVPDGIALDNLKLEFNEPEQEGGMSVTWQANASND